MLLQPTLKQTLQLHTALWLPPLGALALAYIVFDHTPMFLLGSQQFRFTQTFAALYMVLANYWCIWFFRKKLQHVQQADGILKKLQLYYNLSFVKFGILCSVLVVGIVGYLLTYHWSLLLLVGIQAVLFFMQRPHPILASAHLQVNRKELFV